MKKIKCLTIALFLCLICTACGGGGGGGGRGASFKKSMVLLETDFGYCFGTFISKTSILTSADCVYGARYIKVENKNGYQYAPQYIYNGSFRYAGAHNAYCTLDPNNLAIVKMPESFFNSTNAEISPLNYTETNYPGEKMAVWGFGSKNNYLDINQVISKRVTFVSYENNAFLVTDAGAAEIQYKKVYGGHALASRNAILGVQVCSGYYGGGNTYAFVTTRHGNNAAFIQSVAPDSVTKSQIKKAEVDGIAIQSELLAQEGADTNNSYPELLGE